MKHPAELTYAAFRSMGATRRFLFCKTDEKPKFGDLSFDFMAFFGFGSGEFEGEVPPAYKNVRVSVEALSGEPELQQARLASLLKAQAASDGFFGFYTHDGDTIHVLREDPEGVALTHLHALNWHYYTQLGDRGRAVGILKALNRRHFLFESYDTQNRILEQYVKLSVL